MSHTLSPSLLLTLRPIQSSTLPSSISTYAHTPDLTHHSECLPTVLSISLTPHPPKTMSLSRSAQSRVRNHLCRPVPLRPLWQHTLTSTPTSSEPSPRGSLQPLPDVMPKRPAKSATSMNKSVNFMTTSNTTKIYLNKPPTVH
jgi:hypothetical protein